MKKFIIEQNLRQTVQSEADINRLHSHVRMMASEEKIAVLNVVITQNKMYVICSAVSKEKIRHRAKISKFPIHRLSSIKNTLTKHQA